MVDGLLSKFDALLRKGLLLSLGTLEVVDLLRQRYAQDNKVTDGKRHIWSAWITCAIRYAGELGITHWCLRTMPIRSTWV